MSTIVLTEADNGRSIALSVGDALEIRLFENPTTGYRWEIERIDRSILTERDMTSEKSVAPVPGAGRYIVFVFNAEHAGATQLQFKRWQQWEGDVDQRFNTTISVRG
jgi:inhibitor of cysteine peptidase